MSSDDNSQPPPSAPPPLPEQYAIPRAAIDHWLGIPLDSYVTVDLTRRDWDKLFESFDKLVRAQFTFQESMVAYSNGNNALANEYYHQARALTAESQNAFKTMFTSVMMSAKQSG
jgi:hypothetical protein